MGILHYRNTSIVGLKPNMISLEVQLQDLFQQNTENEMLKILLNAKHSALASSSHRLYIYMLFI